MCEQFMKLLIFLDVCFNHYKAKVILITHLMWKLIHKQKTPIEHEIASIEYTTNPKTRLKNWSGHSNI